MTKNCEQFTPKTKQKTKPLSEKLLLIFHLKIFSISYSMWGWIQPIVRGFKKPDPGQVKELFESATRRQSEQLNWTQKTSVPNKE